jgi:hypothetical protein
MRFLIFIAFLSLAALSHAKEEAQKHLGVFSNEAEGFKIVTVMIHESGMAYFHGAVMGLIGDWKLDAGKSTLSISIYDPSSRKEETINLRFDKDTRSYDIIKPGQEVGKPPYDLHFVSADIPEEIVTAFKAYPEQIKKMKAQAAVEQEFKRLREEQLERERPDYERVVAQIKAEPRTVLANEFQSKELTPLGQYPTKIRAFRDTLADHDVPYPEKVLIELLNQVPDDHHSLFVLLVKRPELTGETLTHFYPEALEWGKLNYTILANIAEHPNTPIEIVRDLAGRKDLAVGATNPAKYRLEKLERANKKQ